MTETTVIKNPIEITRTGKGWTIKRGEYVWGHSPFLPDHSNPEFKEIVEFLNITEEKDKSELARAILRLRVTINLPKKKHNVNPKTYFTEKGKFIIKRLADDILEIHRFVATSDKSVLWRYAPEKGIWVTDGNETIQGITADWMKEHFKRNMALDVERYIRYMNYIDSEKLNGSPNKLVVSNGVLDLGTGELEEFDPELYETYYIPWSYDENADCPKMKQFFKEVCPDDEYRQTLMDFMAYCLVKHHKYKDWLILVGQGDNGKTTFVNLLIKFLGETNTVSISLQDLLRNRFVKAQLHGKIANICDDIPDRPLKNTGTIKILTGTGQITGDIKYRDPITWNNTTKFIFTCNTLPVSEDKTHAFNVRVKIVEFNQQFMKGAENTDVDILEKLCTPREMSGLLNICLKNIEEMSEHKGIRYPFSAEEMLDQYSRFSDPLYVFLIENVLYEKTSSITKAELYSSYVKYCNANKLARKDNNVFSRQVKPYLILNGVLDGYIGNDRAWRGLKIKNVETVEDNKEKTISDY